LDKPELFKPTLVVPENKAVHWRVDPIGSDSKGNVFWLFDDSRLYKEDQKNKTWGLVCQTIDDWTSFPLQYKDTKNKKDKQLYPARSTQAEAWTHE
jgi:hypothetical protein